MSTADRVRLALKAFGYSPEVIAHTLDVSMPRAKRLMRAGAYMSLDELIELCRIMDVDLNRFVGDQVGVAVCLST